MNINFQNMKIVSYNISDSAQWKIDRLLEMTADVLVVPEIACVEDVNLPDCLEMAWNGITWEHAGKQKSKGLGMIWKKGHGQIASWHNPELYYAIPLIVDGVLILGFWPTKRRGLTDKMKYPQIAQQIIKEYLHHFSEQPTVIIGDFNCYVNQSDKSKEFGDVRQVNDLLESAGLYSVYHKLTKEILGHESQATYYHLFKTHMPFMLDYAYSNIEVESFKLLEADLKMSDHVGLEVVLK